MCGLSCLPFFKFLRYSKVTFYPSFKLVSPLLFFLLKYNTHKHNHTHTHINLHKPLTRKSTHALFRSTLPHALRDFHLSLSTEGQWMVCFKVSQWRSEPLSRFTDFSKNAQKLQDVWRHRIYSGRPCLAWVPVSLHWQTFPSLSTISGWLVWQSGRQIEVLFQNLTSCLNVYRRLNWNRHAYVTDLECSSHEVTHTLVFYTNNTWREISSQWILMQFDVSMLQTTILIVCCIQGIHFYRFMHSLAWELNPWPWQSFNTF